jgi:hypothetical protein
MNIKFKNVSGMDAWILIHRHAENWSDAGRLMEEWRDANPPAAPAPDVEPVAWLFQNEETGLTECVDIQQVEWGFEKNNPRWQKIAPLYTHPPAADVQELVEALRLMIDSHTEGGFPSATVVIAQAALEKWEGK